MGKQTTLQTQPKLCFLLATQFMDFNRKLLYLLYNKQINKNSKQTRNELYLMVGWCTPKNLIRSFAKFLKKLRY